MYSDTTILLSGQWKFTRLSNVPAKWLMGFLKHAKECRCDICKDKELIEYIRTNAEKLKARSEQSPKIDGIGYKTNSIGGNIVCEAVNKIIFASEKIAKDEIRRIQNREQEEKKPVRTYECKFCSGWHLTSKPFDKEKANKKSTIINNK